jgi:DNA-binding GntR family transcriptional regulator
MFFSHTKLYTKPNVKTRREGVNADRNKTLACPALCLHAAEIAVKVWNRMPPRRKNTLRDSVYESVKAMIVTGQLPPGARMTEADLAEKLKVSRTPVREALNRLERDDLVTGRPRQGYTVKAFDLTMFREAFEVRELLDGHATELATAKITPDGKKRLRAMVAECERLAASSERNSHDMFKELQVGIDIHRVIAEISGNAMLCDLINKILDKCQHYVWMELLWFDEWKLTRHEHTAIVEAICAGDAKRAGDLARHHVRGSLNNILRMLETKSEYQNFLVGAS